MPPSSPSFAPSFQIIVVPPAEDCQPDYLVFAAHHGLEPHELTADPDFASLDAALARIRGPEHSRHVPDAEDLTIRDDLTVRDDSEIVEVVKVRRRSASQSEPPAALPPPPKPKSLKSRAGSAFRSIKNLARVASRSTSTTGRPYAHQVFASSQSTQATFSSAPQPATPPAPSRRGSVILTQLFRTPSPIHDTPPALAGHYPDDDEADVFDEEDDDDQDSIPSRGPSPTPSTRTFASSVRRRFSVLNFIKPASAPPPRPSSPPTLSRGSTVPSTSSSLPPTPTEESYPSPCEKGADDDPDRTIGEMRLDSLHFDSLSFDADNF
ncbi:hypothetical protein R3P38DRAFT_2954071 [Favolaschia claudopus]|uniref:Uncharacterized protein n=1 Tax=Favolaschia claudopus TaxID=2862362 RepID=A0AAW0BCA8_9AGAR